MLGRRIKAVGPQKVSGAQLTDTSKTCICMSQQLINTTRDTYGSSSPALNFIQKRLIENKKPR